MSKTDRPKYARNKFAREEKDRKRAEAAVRQAAYDALTIDQKLAKLGDRPAVKQRIKLAAEAITHNAAQKIAKEVEQGILAPGDKTVIIGKTKKPKKGKAKKNA